MHQSCVLQQVAKGNSEEREQPELAQHYLAYHHNVRSTLRLQLATTPTLRVTSAV